MKLEFSKASIFDINNNKHDITFSREWISEVRRRLISACGVIEDIYLLKESFTVETEASARSSIAEITALISTLSEAESFHESNEVIRTGIQEAIENARSLVETARSQYETIAKWYDV